MPRETYQRKNRRNDFNSELYDDDVIDLSRAVLAIKKYIKLLVLLPILFGAITGIYTKFFVEPVYESSASIFLTPVVGVEGNVDYNSQQSNSKLVNNVVVLLTQDNIMSTVAKKVGLKSSQAVRDTLTITNISNTELVTISSRTNDPQLSKDIVELTVNTFIEVMQNNLNLQNIEIVDSAKLSFVPVGPSIIKNSIIGAFVGLVIAMIYVFLKEITDKKVKSKEEAELFFGFPVFIELPVIESED